MHIFFLRNFSHLFSKWLMTSEGFKIIHIFGVPSLSTLGTYFQISTGNPLLYSAHFSSCQKLDFLLSLPQSCLLSPAVFSVLMDSIPPPNILESPTFSLCSSHSPTHPLQLFTSSFGLDLVQFHKYGLTECCEACMILTVQKLKTRHNPSLKRT